MHIQSDTLLPADLFENFRNKCIEIYEPDPAHFLSVPALAWQACLKKERSTIRFIHQYWYVTDGWKRNLGGICHAIYRYAKASNKYMKNYDKNTESSYLEYLDASDL